MQPVASGFEQYAKLRVVFVLLWVNEWTHWSSFQSLPKPTLRLPIIPLRRNCCSFCSWCSRSLHCQQSGISAHVAGFKCNIWHGGSQHTFVSPVEPILHWRHIPRVVQVLFKQQNTVIYNDQETESYPVTCSVPQGSVLGPLEFSAYTGDITELTDHHDVGCHLYANDTQLYECCLPENVSVVWNRLASCVTEVAPWCASRCLQLNADTTEMVWFGSKANLAKLESADCTLPVGSEMIEPVSTVRDLGVLLDSNLPMKQHVNKVATANYGD